MGQDTLGDHMHIQSMNKLCNTYASVVTKRILAHAYQFSSYS